MLLDLIAQYYTYLWLVLGAVAFLKVILSNIFQSDLEGFSGIIFALFKWYGRDEQEMEDISRRRTIMRIHNVITLLLYALILAVTAASIILSLFATH